MGRPLYAAVEPGAYPGEISSDGRAIMFIDDADAQRWSDAKAEAGDRASVDVTDQRTNTRWLIQSAPCGADCHCSVQADPL